MAAHRRIGSSRGSRRAIRAAGGGAVLLAVVAAGVAGAAAHLVPRAVYTGHSCSGSSYPGTSCTFHFRSNASGTTLRSFGKTVTDTWGCGNGGGLALLGGSAKSHTPIPTIRVRPDGSLHGSLVYTFRPTSGPPERITSSVTGHLTRRGRAAVVSFHQRASGRSCSTAPVTLTAG